MAFKLLKRDASYARFIDKVAIKSHVADLLGQDWVVPTLWQGTELPVTRTWSTPYVLKANNSSGRNIFVRSERDEDWTKIRTRAHRWLKSPHPPLKGEWLYTQIEPRLLVEPLLGDGTLPPDFKFYVFEGRVRLIEYVSGRDKRYLCKLLDREWNPVAASIRNRSNPTDVAKPQNLETLVWAAETLGRAFNFVRVDLYEVGGRPYFGELTFTPSAGVERYDPIDLDFQLGSYWPWKDSKSTDRDLATSNAPSQS